MASEWDAMRQACRDVCEGFEKIVKMTIVIVQKRHHTRFFPGRTGISVDRNNNVPPGTIVDTTITSPDEPQYYLVSHQAVQGVARPTQYCILLDDGNHKMDDLQALTNAVSIRADFLNLYNCFFLYVLIVRHCARSFVYN